MMDKEKTFKRQRQIRVEISNLEKYQRIGPFKLEKPYQSGWWGTYELRQDILNRKDSDFFEWVLKHINSKTHSHRQDFKIASFSNKNKMVSKKPGLKLLQQRSFDKMIEHPKYGQKVQRYFIEKTFHYAYGANYSKWEFVYPWVFQWKITPCMITEYYDLRGDVVAKIEELEKEFQKLGDWNLYMKNIYGSNNFDCFANEAVFVKHARNAGIDSVNFSGGNSSLRIRIKKEIKDLIDEHNNGF
jgi:hypothetical protein